MSNFETSPHPDAPQKARKPPAPQKLVGIENLVKEFSIGKESFGHKPTMLRAVDNVSLEINSGETFGLVGESGCGKTTIARCLMRLAIPSSGRIMFRDTDVTALKGKELRRFRLHMQMVFQDPHASLDSRMTARQIVEEPLTIHDIGDRKERREKVDEILTLVGIDPSQGNRKPHGFSGGQAQRIALARALVLNPDMLVLDEPVSALDVSIQAQVLNFLRDIQDRFSLTYLFIVHDLVVAEYFCDRIAVLYLGAVVEMAESHVLFREPLHPYTVSLVSAVPVPDPESRGRGSRIVLSGEVSPSGAQMSGCRFRTRCPIGRNRENCRDISPKLVEKSPGHWVACHFPGELEHAVTAASNIASPP
ncbi:MAG: ATP-binding cassette domain-containing protein [Albidovulum sp.]|nr:ATP-binding cassette domain-containing protein [Albidovulum sp.]